jgi:hypothetical protein
MPRPVGWALGEAQKRAKKDRSPLKTRKLQPDFSKFLVSVHLFSAISLEDASIPGNKKRQSH